MKRLIILIDDDPDDLELMVNAINEFDADIECRTFTDPTVGISHLIDELTTQPACIFIDVHLPKMTGHECLTAIRSIPSLATVPIAMVSSAMREEDEEALKLLGANFLFLKGHEFEVYRSMLKTVLEAHVRSADPSGGSVES